VKFMNNRWLHSQPYRDEAGEGEGGGGEGEGEGSGEGEGEGTGEGEGEGGKPEPSWRDRFTAHQGKDEDYAPILGRFQDEASFIQGAVQAHEKLRAGETATGLPDDPTDEQLGAYREANGIPVDGKYDFSAADRELSEMDLEMLGPVSEIAHKHNISQEALTELMGTYMGETDKVVELMHTQDNLDAQEFTTQMKEQWGPEFTINMNRASNQLNLLPESIRDQVKQAKMPDGRGIMNSPEFMTWLVGVDRQITPMDPMKGGTEATLNDARQVVAKAKDRMRDDSIGWHKDKQAQAEYMQAQTMIDQFEGSQ